MRAPGSLMPGVPASHTSATLSPRRSAATISSARAASLCACTAKGRLAIDRCASSVAVTRVSSAPMRSTLPSTSTARSVTSRRLPSGVATTYNVPARARCSRPRAGSPVPDNASPFPPRSAASTFAVAPPARARRPTPLAWVAGALFALSGAFCAAQVPATSTFEPPPPGAAPALVPAPSPDLPPAVVPAPPPRPAGPPIALVLPLASPDYARAAEAVRDGFLAAAEAAGAKDRVRVIPHANDDVNAAFDAARDGGARVVVGPLVRDDLKALIAADRDLPVTIALNQLDDAAPLPPRVYTFALAIEADARTIATRMNAEGIHNVAVIGGETPLMKRFAHAFVGEWILLGGNLPQIFPLVASRTVFARCAVSSRRPTSTRSSSRPTAPTPRWPAPSRPASPPGQAARSTSAKGPRPRAISRKCASST